MGNKKGGILAQMYSDLMGTLRSQYFNIGTNIYKWKDMPKEIPIRYPEKWLYENGMCVFFEHPQAGFVCLQVATESIQKNVYGEPSEWRCVAVGDLSGTLTSMKLDETNSVLIRNDTMYRATQPYVDVMLKQMINVELTMRLNINAQKNAMWIKCSDEDVLQKKNDFYEYYECQPVFFKDAMSPHDFEFINPGIKYIGNELADTYNIYKYRLLSYLGLDNPGVDKKERVLMAEESSNSDEIMMIRNARMEQREIACEKINDLFGLNVSVEYNEQLNTERDVGVAGLLSGTQPTGMAPKQS